MLLEVFSYLAESWLLFAYKAVAEKRNKKEYSYGLLKITCALGDYNRVIAAIQEIKEFDPQLSDDFLKTVKRIVFVETRGSDVLLAKGTILISENDQSHLASKVHLAGWLLYYYALLSSVKKIGLLFWSGQKYVEAKEEGTKLRNSFLSGSCYRPN
jgi:hypothetical protein